MAWRRCAGAGAVRRRLASGQPCTRRARVGARLEGSLLAPQLRPGGLAITAAAQAEDHSQMHGECGCLAACCTLGSVAHVSGSKQASKPAWSQRASNASLVYKEVT